MIPVSDRADPADGSRDRNSKPPTRTVEAVSPVSDTTNPMWIVSAFEQGSALRYGDWFRSCNTVTRRHGKVEALLFMRDSQSANVRSPTVRIFASCFFFRVRYFSGVAE